MIPTPHATIEHIKAEGRPFLSIITPCFKRPRSLIRNRASVTAQRRKDIEQILVIDEVGYGWTWVAREVARATSLTSGQYVMGLDDDDELAAPDVISLLEQDLQLVEFAPEVIVTLCEIQHPGGRRVIVPEPAYWGGPPAKGHISGQCVLLRRDVRMKHLDDFVADDDGVVIDFPWMRAVLDPAKGYRVVWLPLLVSRMQSRGLGRTEADMAAQVEAL